VNEPSLAVLEDRVWTTVPAFSTSIFTYDPTSPDDVHAISWLDPRTQDSPPFGEVTVIDGDVDAVFTVYAFRQTFAFVIFVVRSVQVVPVLLM
jgi:hypothetical protein